MSLLPWLLTAFWVTGTVCAVLPVVYEISLDPDLENLTFESALTLRIFVDRPALPVLQLKAKSLQVRNVTVLDQIGNVADLKSQPVVNETSETLSIEFEEPIGQGLFVVLLEYSGLIGPDFQVSPDRKILLTDFGFSNAKYLFPSVGDSSSVFSLTLVLPENSTVISNSPLKSEHTENGKTIFAFSTTDMIQPYRLGFVVLNSPVLHQTKSTDATEVGFYTLVPEKPYHSKIQTFCNQVLEKLVQLYPFPKQYVNIVILPDFPRSKSVVSPGLVVFRESDVEFYTSAEFRQPLQDLANLQETLARAIITQAAWWDDSLTNFWYYSGSVQWYQNEILEQLQQTVQPVTVVLQELLAKEPNSLSISLQFDGTWTESFIVKSFFVYRMLTNVLHREEDLFNTTEGLLPYQWINEPTYPVLEVSYNATTNSTTFRQKSSSNVSWIIPVNIATAKKSYFDDTKITLILQTIEHSQSVDYLDANTWFIVNKQQYGYYRVNYDQRNWDHLIALFNSDKFSEVHPSNRAQVIDDAYSVATLGLTTFENYLKLISYLVRETDVAPLSAFYRSANRIRVLSGPSDTYEKFRKYTNGIAEHLYRHFGKSVQNSTLTDRLFRIQTLSFLANSGHQAVLSELSAVLLNLNATSPDPDLQEAAYCGGNKQATLQSTQLDNLLEIYNATGSITVLKGLTCAGNKDVLKDLLEATIHNNTQRLKRVDVKQKHKLPEVLSIIESGPLVALTFIRSSPEAIFTMFNQEELAQIFLALSVNVVEVEEKITFDEIRQWVENNTSLSLDTVFAKAEQNIRDNFAWRSIYLPIIDGFLSDAITENNSTSTSTSTSTTTSTTTEATTPAPSSSLNLRIDIGLLLLTGAHFVFHK